MSSVLDRVFSKFDDADPNNAGSNPYINGHSVNTVEIQSVKVRESDNGPKIFLIVEYVVRETNREDVKVDDIVYAWVHDLTNQHFGLPNCKQFLAAAVGLDPNSDEAKELDRSAIDEAIGNDQVLKGQRAMLTTTPRTTKGEGKEFTVHKWTPCKEGQG